MLRTVKELTARRKATSSSSMRAATRSRSSPTTVSIPLSSRPSSTFRGRPPRRLRTRAWPRAARS
jgi:hypothetical protein